MKPFGDPNAKTASHSKAAQKRRFQPKGSRMQCQNFSRRLFEWFAILAMLVGFLNSAIGSKETKLKKDAYGDALPKGAIARLGTTRLVHVGGIEGLAVSPDGKIVASCVGEAEPIPKAQQKPEKGSHIESSLGQYRGAIRLWDTKTGRLLHEIVTPADHVTAFCFSADGKHLFAGCGSNFGMVACWEVATGKKCWQRRAITNKDGVLVAPAKILSLVSRGDRLIASYQRTVGVASEPAPRWDMGLWDGSGTQLAVQIRSVRTGRLLPLPKSLFSTIQNAPRDKIIIFWNCKISPDGKYAVVVMNKGAPHLRADFKTGKFGGYPACRLKIVDVETGKVVHSYPTQLGEFRGLAFSPDGRTLASLEKQKVWAIDVKTGKKRLLFTAEAKSIRRLTFLDSKTLWVTFYRGFWVWDTKNGKLLKEVQNPPVVSAKGGSMEAGVEGSRIRIINSKTKKPLQEFLEHRKTPQVRYSLRSPRLLISRDLEFVGYWDARTWKLKDKFDYPTLKSSSRIFRYPGAYGHWEMDDSFSVELLTYGKARKKGWELRVMKTGGRGCISETPNAPRSMRFSPSGNRVAVWGWHNKDRFEISVHDTNSGKRLCSVEPDLVKWLGFKPRKVFSPHGKYFVTNGSPTHIDFYDLKTGKKTPPIKPNVPKGTTSTIVNFWFSKDGQTIFGEVHKRGQSGENVSVAIWNLHTKQSIQQVVVEPAMLVWAKRSLVTKLLLGAAVTNDLRLIAYGRRYSKTIQLVEVATGTIRGELKGHEGPIASLSFSPDDQQLASSSEDTTILIWDMNRPFQSAKFAKRLTQAQLQAHWSTLNERDAKKADAAIWSLVRASKDSLPFLAKRLRPVPSPSKDQVQKLIKSLNSENFRTRRKAVFELARYGEVVLGELKSAIKRNNPLETQVRLSKLIEKAEQAALPFGTKERIRQWRALEVLERIRSKEAFRLVRELAGGAPSARLTKEARKVLTRMERVAKQ